ncbi:MAG TPA: hypothetical protein VF108_13485, partial [Actinomycetota bacterium]
MGAAANLLRRAAALLDPADPDRLRISWELAQSLVEAGAIAEAREVATASVDLARAAGDETAEGYATCALWIARVVSDPQLDVDAWGSDADRLIELFDRLDDRRGSALAWAQKAIVLWFRERLAECAEASERAVENAIASGETYIASDMRGHFLAATGLGPRPFAERRPLLESTLRDAVARGDRRLEQATLQGFAMEAAFQGHFDEARTNAELARQIKQELGLTLDYWANAMGLGRIEWMAGDLDAATAVLREACEALEALGETAYLSTAAALLAHFELELGDRAAAERWTDVARRTASSGDRSSQVAIAQMDGLLAAHAGADGWPHFRRALELVDENDSPIWRSEVRIVTARALTSTHFDVAARLAREALQIAEAKGATVYADWARQL